MALRQVRGLPEKKIGLPAREPYVARDVREFLRQRMEVAEVTHEGRSAKNVGAMLRNYINRHPDTCSGIGSTVRGGVAYLYRKD